MSSPKPGHELAGAGMCCELKVHLPPPAVTMREVDGRPLAVCAPCAHALDRRAREAVRFADDMAEAARLYRDVTDALVNGGFPAEVTQTGGMCLAIEVRVGERKYLIVDLDDSLPWSGQPIGFTVFEDKEGAAPYLVKISSPSVPALVQELRRLA